MNRYSFSALLLLLPLFIGGCASRNVEAQWRERVDREIRTLGYRNWIVIGESAFPVHSRRGVRTLVVDDEIPNVLHGVLDSLEGLQNVTPRIHMAREHRHVPNDLAPGMDQYRKQLEDALHGHPVREMQHRSLSFMLEDSSRSFVVLVLKTRTALPYSSVFIELDSGYWDAEAEKEVRRSVEAELRNQSS